MYLPVVYICTYRHPSARYAIFPPKPATGTRKGGALAALPPPRGRHGSGLRDRRHQRPRPRLGVADDPHSPPPGAAGGQPPVPVNAGSGRCERPPGGDQASVCWLG